MKKGTKKTTVIIVVIIILLLFLDSAQALLLKRSPIIRYHYTIRGNSDVKVIDKGILIDTYYCKNSNVISVLKGSSYSCASPKPIYTIEDTSKKIPGFSCAMALEEIYKDDRDTYYLSCIKSSMIIVTYEDGTKENIKEALAKGNISIRDLDRFNIAYLIG